MKKYWIYYLGIILLLSATIWWMIFQWHLCRGQGFSFWYCIQHCG